MFLCRPLIARADNSQQQVVPLKGSRNKVVSLKSEGTRRTPMKNSITVQRRNSIDPFEKMFAPLIQQGVGFDRLFESMNRAMRDANEGGKYPPYDIVQTSQDDYTITLAVAGFELSEIAVNLDNGLLTVAGDKPSAGVRDVEKAKYLHRGIAFRKFQHKFQLTDHIRVEGAKLKNGLLTVFLHRELPEALKPRTIEIVTD